METENLSFSSELKIYLLRINNDIRKVRYLDGLQKYPL